MQFLMVFISLGLSPRLKLAIFLASVDEIWSAVHRGGTRGGRLSVDGARNQEPDGDTRRGDSDLDRFGPSGRRNTLRLVSLVYCIEMHID